MVLAPGRSSFLPIVDCYGPCCLLQVGWLKASDQTVLTMHTRVVTHNSRVSVSHDNQRTWHLHIRQVKESDRGCYMCQINTVAMKSQLGCIDVHGE